jgi:hypothetical protein
MAKSNSQVPDQETYLKHLAIRLRDIELQEALKLKAKANETRAKEAGIDIADMKQDIKMSSWAPSEIAKWFAGKLTLLRYRSVDIGKQFDLFSGVNPTVAAAPDFRPAGLYAAMKGKPCQPPAHLSGTDAQQWTEGWHEGDKHRANAVEEGEINKAQAMAEAMEGGGETPAEDNRTQLTGGVIQGAGESDDGEGETLFLVLGDFANAEKLSDCTLANYSGPPQDLEVAPRVVVEHDGEELVLKNRDGETSAQADGEPQTQAGEAEAPHEPVELSKGLDAPDEFEASAEELRKQAGRKPSEALSQSAKAAAAREAALTPPAKPKKPKTAAKKGDDAPL